MDLILNMTRLRNDHAVGYVYKDMSQVGLCKLENEILRENVIFQRF